MGHFYVLILYLRHGEIFRRFSPAFSRHSPTSTPILPLIHCQFCIAVIDLIKFTIMTDIQDSREQKRQERQKRREERRQRWAQGAQGQFGIISGRNSNIITGVFILLIGIVALMRATIPDFPDWVFDWHTGLIA